MLQSNDLAYALKRAEDMGLETGTITLHVSKGQFHHAEYHVIDARQPQKNLDAITPKP